MNGVPPRASAVGRRTRRATVLWLIVGVVIWNGVFDFVQTRGIKEFLLQTALYELGRGPEVSLPAAMSVVTRDAIWISTAWASAIVAAGLLTIRAFTRGVQSSD